MQLKLYYCQDAMYSDTHINVSVYKGVLNHPQKGTIEIALELQDAIKGHSGGRFNVLFRDMDDTIDEDDRKYFAHVSWWQKQQLIWMFGQNWFQKPDNIWKIVNLFIGFIVGYIGGKNL